MQLKNHRTVAGWAVSESKCASCESPCQSLAFQVLSGPLVVLLL